MRLNPPTSGRFATISLVLTVLFLCALAACAPPVSPTPTPPPAIKLKVLLGTQFSFAPLLIAKEEGYFKEQGLDIDFVASSGGGSSTMIPVLISGGLDVVAGSVNFAQLNAMAQGASIKFVADKGYLDPKGCVANAYFVRRELLDKLKDLSQLKGLKMSTVSGVGMTNSIMNQILERAHLSAKDVTPVSLTDAEAYQAMQEGSLDVAEVSEPQLSTEWKNDKVAMWMPLAQASPNTQLAVITFGPNILKNNPEAGRRFMVAYLKGVRQYNQGKTDANLDILSKSTGLDRDQLKAMCFSQIRNDGMIDTDSITRYEEWGVSKKLLDKAVEPDQFWDPSFVNYANDALKKAPQ